MSLLDVTTARLQRSLDLFEELVREIPESALGDKLPGLRSNTVGQQLWCVVGARESYRRAIAAGAWDGFSCSLAAADCAKRQAVQNALSTSGRDVLGILRSGGSFSDRQYELILDLLEHEAAHQGQLIRYLYGLNLPLPGAWRKRYALE